MRAVEERGRERIWPGETLQHECIEGIKNITRDECSSVYLAAEKQPATLCCVTPLVCIFWSLQELKSKHTNSDGCEKKQQKNVKERNTEVFIACCFCC